MGTELAVQASGVPMVASAINAIKERMNVVTTVYRDIMEDGKDFGKIPGCGDKPTLLKPGAEKLMMAFRIAPITEKVEVERFDGNHRDYRVTITLSNSAGEILGSGVGSCSTLESKYRYRNIAGYEITGEPIPKDSKEKKAEYRKKGFGMKQIDGIWEWVKYTDSQKSENPDPADQWNTVLKMAKKRALVDACLTCLGASTMFTQDIEDMAHSEPAKMHTEAPKKPEPQHSKPVAPEAPDTLQEARDLYHRMTAHVAGLSTEVKAEVKKIISEQCSGRKFAELNEGEIRLIISLVNGVLDEAADSGNTERTPEGGAQ